MADTAKTLNDSITEVVLRDIRVVLRIDEYNASHHRTYVRMVHPNVNKTMALTSWKGPNSYNYYDLNYFCPCGWRRFALKVPSDLPDDFWKNSSNMYHGLQPEFVQAIVRDGFKPNECQHDGKAVYLTPSIRYAAHPRFARIQVYKGLYYQVILQCRVLNSKLTAFKDAVKKGGVPGKGTEEIPGTGETMKVRKKMTIDDNHHNDLMECLWFSDTFVKARHGLVVAGVMIRCLGTNPIDLEENRWWQEFRPRSDLMKYHVKHI
jgi:hypothetical protein